MNSVFHSRDHRTATAENHVFHERGAEVFVALVEGGFEHVGQSGWDLFVDVGGLPGDLGEKDFGGPEDGLLGELDDVAIGKFVAFFFKGPFIRKELVFVVVGDLDIFLLNLFDNFAVFNLVFGLKGN